MNKATLSFQHKSASQSHCIRAEDLENAALHARQRAIKTHQIVESQYLYETGGWKNLLKDYSINQQNQSKTVSEQPEIKEDRVGNFLAIEKTSLSTIFCISPSQNNSIINPDVPIQKKIDLVSPPLCPSTKPEIGDAIVFGVVEGTVEAPKIAYLTESKPVTEEILALSTPVKPTEIFRMASSCQENACKHFDGTNCRLAMRIVSQLPSVVDVLPACQIRSNCRWWQQEGKSACFRCPQIVTDSRYSSEIIRQVADPNNYNI